MAPTNTDKVLFPESSYQLIGTAYEIYNKMGFGMQEKYHQRAFVELLNKQKINFEREKCVEIYFENKSIGRYFLDFVIDNKIVIELKVKPHLGYIHINQVLNYLKQLNLELAILIYFTKDGVKFRRVLNSSILLA